jgi:hypothetical protein
MTSEMITTGSRVIEPMHFKDSGTSTDIGETIPDEGRAVSVDEHEDHHIEPGVARNESPIEEVAL